MKKTTAMLVALLLAFPVYSQVKVGVGAKTDTGVNVGTGNARVGAGVNADARADARANSNAGGEQRGLERAETRMSEEGREHEKATTAPHGKKKGHSRSAKAETHTEGSATTR